MRRLDRVSTTRHPGIPGRAFGRRPSIGVFGAALAVVLGWLPAGTGFALDGGVDVRSSRQTNQVDGLTFDTNSLRQMVYARQAVLLAPSLTLDADARLTRDLAGSDFSQQAQDTERNSTFGAVRLGYRVKSTLLGVSGSWLEQRETFPPSLARDLSRGDYQLWLKSGFRNGPSVRATAAQRDSRREASFTETVRNRERYGSLASEYTSGIGEFRYRLSVLANSDRDGRGQTQWANMFEYGRALRLADDKVSATVRLRSSFFDQSSRSAEAGETRILLAPLAGGVRLDDTPEIQDPLEPAPVSVPGLYDRDRETPTEINLGDSAPPVRDYGGDYRNIQFDFGDDKELDSAVLYVDSRLLHPELYRWRVFVSDDPEGLQWEELDAGRVSVDYRDWDTGEQGWAVTLAGAVSARFFKMVDVKLGSTVPDLFVTELEVYAREAARETRNAFHAQDHRFDGHLAYDATSRLRFIYDTTLRERRQETGGDLSERDHGLTSQWTSGKTVLSGRIQSNRTSRAGGRNTEFRSYQLAAAHGGGTALATQVTWNRAEDDLGDRNRTTNAVSAGADWRAAPRLRVRERVAYATRSDPAVSSAARSITVVTGVESRPLTPLTVNVDHSRRWVDREAGTGFQAFSETTFRVDWIPVPRISISNQAKLYLRDRSDWNVRSLASWTLLDTGVLELGVTGNSFRDTRRDAVQQGVSATARWRPRSRVVLDGGIGWERLKTAGNVETPVATNLHAAWMF